MRTVFIGAGQVSIETAKALSEKGHEVIVIEIDKDKIEDLSEDVDCSFLHGDGGRPDILREVNPEQTDFLFCLADSDQANLIASLVGRSLGFKRVVTTISDPQFEEICHELGLEDTIVRSRAISHYLEDMVSGSEDADSFTALKEEARFFTLVAKETDAVVVTDLKLPTDAKVICYYRKGKFFHADADTELHEGDEVVILTHSKNMAKLQERWHATQTAGEPSESASKKHR